MRGIQDRAVQRQSWGEEGGHIMGWGGELRGGGDN